MITPVGSTPAIHEQPAPQRAPQPPQQPAKNGNLSRDQVTLKSTGQTDQDHDGDSH